MEPFYSFIFSPLHKKTTSTTKPYTHFHLQLANEVRLMARGGGAYSPREVEWSTIQSYFSPFFSFTSPSPLKYTPNSLFSPHHTFSVANEILAGEEGGGAYSPIQDERTTSHL